MVLYALPELDGAIDAVALGGLSSGGDVEPWALGVEVALEVSFDEFLFVFDEFLLVFDGF